MTHKVYTPQDYRSDLNPSWCKGCSYYSILSALTQVFTRKQPDPVNLNIISGIGCSSRMSLYFNTFGMHTLHGRAIPVAVGSRLVRPDLPVIVIGGDGDLFSIGTGHFVHAARKNFNITVLCLDNRIYAMTKNQASPTSIIGHPGTLTPYGKLSAVLNIVEFSISCGATFVARSHSSSPDHLKEVISQAIDHNGFSLVEILSPCKTFNKETTQIEHRDQLININTESGHDPSDKTSALLLASASNNYDQTHEKIPIGIYLKSNAPSFEQQIMHVQEKYERSDINEIFQKLSIYNNKRSVKNCQS